MYLFGGGGYIWHSEPVEIIFQSRFFVTVWVLGLTLRTSDSVAPSSLPHKVYFLIFIQYFCFYSY